VASLLKCDDQKKSLTYRENASAVFFSFVLKYSNSLGHDVTCRDLKCEK